MVIAMQVRRYAGFLVFAVAAFASVATSAPPRWELDATATLETTVPTGPANQFAISAEARGPRNGHDGGDVDVFLELRAGVDNVEPALVTVTLRSEADPSLFQTQDVEVFSASQADTVTVSLPAWEACEAGPCFDDFRLEIAVVTANTSVVVNGEIRAVLRGRDENPEPDSEVLVDVTPLGAP